MPDFLTVETCANEERNDSNENVVITRCPVPASEGHGGVRKVIVMGEDLLGREGSRQPAWRRPIFCCPSVMAALSPIRGMICNRLGEAKYTVSNFLEERCELKTTR
jgi:hypothetical protein